MKFEAYPDGWTCIICGDEYLEDSNGEQIGEITEGTICKKCKEDGE